MNIREALLHEHSKKQTNKIATFIGKDKDKFMVLIKCLFDKNTVIHQRAAWVLSVCNDQYPYLIKPYLRRTISALELPYHPAVKRNILRILQNQEIPLSLQGNLTNILFKILQSSEEPVAVKCFGMTVLFNMCNMYPGLKPELQAIITGQLPFSTSGYKSRASKILHELAQ